VGEVQALLQEVVFGIFINWPTRPHVLYTLRQQSGWDSLAIHGLSSIFPMECLHIDCLVAMFPLPQGRDLALISLV